MNSGASSSSSVSRSPLAKASRKRRASALLLSSDDTGASSSLLLPNPVTLAGRHHEYDATRRDQAHSLGLIHRSAWKEISAKSDFRFTEFSEVSLCSECA